mgnify:FL=1
MVENMVYLNSKTKYQLSEHITAIWKMMGYVNHDTKKSLAASLTPETIFNILFDLSDKSIETINYVKVIDTLTNLFTSYLFKDCLSSYRNHKILNAPDWVVKEIVYNYLKVVVIFTGNWDHVRKNFGTATLPEILSLAKKFNIELWKF